MLGRILRLPGGWEGLDLPGVDSRISGVILSTELPFKPTEAV
jgi:hypothetical protein